ncbi:MotA/TolQ/ExbB proton channel family protein [Aetokthonos hydrillicola Thurmond2011]|uniref:MotA/TolQ/ExbB proton channel family protein n=1 Tax=Aetokthonos hydrillicola Thurmond2011 TaxID=2712845 RepID=A0AAP5M674_9CYAN|nr:MotA/TolQ/ExbB proton channel family protein [Aetokthonos hydrillicola]MBO3458866.1 MotA/TolQ/ExbB proton channel family protein [Aetokthonos hydrillicola CCALA 1050]MBW4587286.1 MotA/TolQ/ExbB proton channel family protein [Aetokthonos hydrillicola CCALA 1050]MDR9896691.1 MotA/TolQ/ExbB proton channel family protein [Aetokthonos hydrillicola Thurmond2011]
MDILVIFQKVGPVIWLLLFFSVLCLSVVLERLWFWLRILTQEKEIVDRVLDAAQDNWLTATEIARRATDQPIGRFLYAPLSLPKSTPELFRLALESTAETELAQMRRGEKVLELVIAVAPLLGLFGTVWGLIKALESIRIGDLGTESTAGVTTGIGEALYSTAMGLAIAIVSLIFYRLFQAFVVNQVKVFRKAGNELEILYLQFPPDLNNSDIQESRPYTSPPRKKVKNKFSETVTGIPSEPVTAIPPESDLSEPKDTQEFNS